MRANKELLKLKEQKQEIKQNKRTNTTLNKSNKIHPLLHAQLTEPKTTPHTKHSRAEKQSPGQKTNTAKTITG
jgi:hypothetical protein